MFHLKWNFSYHRSIRIDCSEHMGRRWGGFNKRLFRFKEIWTREDECAKVISNDWNRVASSFSNVDDKSIMIKFSLFCLPLITNLLIR